jgi:uncharacterized protein with HEPN domain
MSPEAGTFLWDAVNAARLALSFEQGRSFDDYQADAMLRSAVERPDRRRSAWAVMR